MRLIDDVENMVTDVCDEGLSLVGTVRGRYCAANTGKVTATIGDQPNTVRVHRWGPEVLTA